MRSSTCAQIIGQSVLSFFFFYLFWFDGHWRVTRGRKNIISLKLSFFTSFDYYRTLMMITEGRVTKKKINQTSQFWSALFWFWQETSTENHIFATNLRNCAERKSDAVGVGRTFATTMSQRNIFFVGEKYALCASIYSQESRQIITITRYGRRPKSKPARSIHPTQQCRCSYSSKNQFFDRSP